MSNAEIIDLLPPVKPQALTLGDQLVLATFHTPGGLKAMVDRIHDVVGAHYGTRNTFAKLLHAESYAQLNEKDRYRVWLLLATIGAEPRDYGATDATVPPAVDVIRLRGALLLPRLDSNQEPIGFKPGDEAGELIYLDDYRPTQAPIWRADPLRRAA